MVGVQLTPDPGPGRGAGALGKGRPGPRMLAGRGEDGKRDAVHIGYKALLTFSSDFQIDNILTMALYPIPTVTEKLKKW